MTPRRLFTLEGPLCAVEDAGARTTTMCPKCGRGKREQTGDLSVSLVCENRKIWLSDANAILLADSYSEKLAGRVSVRLSLVRARWEDGIAGSGSAVPKLMQLRASLEMHAAPRSVELENCTCGSVKSVSFNPLVVRRPQGADADAIVWRLAESPDALILSEETREYLESADQDLEFSEVFYE